MAARSTTDAKRFVRRAPNKKSEAYLVATDEMTPRTAVQTGQSTQRNTSSSPIATNRSIETASPRAEVPPARRVVVVRSPNNPNVHRGPIDLGDFGQPNAAEKHKPVLSNGRTAIYLIRRSIQPPNSSQPTEEEVQHEQENE